MNKVVSVIIPIFNSENFLNRCIESVICQSFNNLEIILINDGSTDSSKEIIDDYASKDNRIVVIHKKNGGIGSAYKAAFEVMTGDYVLFVDSDDWLELNAVENLVKLALDNNADMVSFGIKAFNSQGDLVQLTSLKNIDLINTSTEAILKTHFEVLKHPTLVRLYKHELFYDIVIYEQNIGIDEMLTPQLLLKCNRAVYTSDVYYNILIRHDSVCRVEYSEKKIKETINVYRFLIGFVEEKIPQHIEPIYEKYFGIIFQFREYTLTKKYSNDLYFLIESEFRNLFIKIKQYKLKNLMATRLFLKASLLNYFPFIYRILNRINE